MNRFVVGLIGFCLCAAIAMGAALTGPVSRPSAQVNRVNVGVATGQVIYAGAMVSVNSSGYAINATTGALQQVLGYATRSVDSSLAASGTYALDVACGTAYWDGADTTNKAAIGQLAYVVDNHTVSVTGSGLAGLNPAGVVADYDSSHNMLAVRVNDMAASAAITPATMGVVGAATVGTTLTVGTSLAVGTTAAVSGTTTLTNLTVNGAAVLFTHVPIYVDGLAAGTLCYTGSTKALMVR